MTLAVMCAARELANLVLHDRCCIVHGTIDCF